MMKGKVLVIDDNKSVLSALEILLQFEYKTVETIDNPNHVLSFPNLNEFDIILLDMNFSAGINSGNEGLFWLKEIKKKSPNSAVIMMTAYGAIDLAVKALKLGATDFVLKPWNNEKLLVTVKTAYQLRKSKKEINKLKEKESQLKQLINEDKSPIIGSSEALTTVLNLTRKVSTTDVNVLITGENGTGKELIAKELHSLSKRKEEVFISVDMGSISDTLLESELFGHIKGSFTDAKEDRVGKFEAANGGTLFLDEIGNLSLPGQAKLLSALQNRVIVKVGSNTPISIDIRLICATNGNLGQMVSEGTFREDLLYRINTITVEVPPLRDRREDIPTLTNFYLELFSRKYDKPGLRINSKAFDKLMAYQWPGNVRELRHTVERAVILSEETILEPTDFSISDKTSQVLEVSSSTLDEMQDRMIMKAMDENNGNLSAAANQLGITRQTLYNKLKKMQ